MIVYSARRQSVATRDVLAALRAPLDRLQEGAAPEKLRDALIDFGTFESGLADALCPERDDYPATLDLAREISMMLARALCGSACDLRIGSAFDTLCRSPLPQHVELSVPEGYAYYALYPEMYLAAARAWWREAKPERVVVMGIRSIGTSLSAVVAAALEKDGARVRRYTVRPRAHPFQRQIALQPEFETELRRRADWHFGVVDEGPGLSGSSFGTVAEKLSELGVPDDRIVLFPSRETDGGAFLNAGARERWLRHRKYCKSFEDVIGRNTGLDISAGKWRTLFFSDQIQYPAVQPEHERRKYIEGVNGQKTLRKFAGLGQYGRRSFDRAVALADAGFTPRPIAIEDGFLVSDFASGRPVAGADMRPELLDRMSAYLIHLARHYSQVTPAPYDELCEMIELNVREGLGERNFSLERFKGAVRGASTVEIDGRMLPHEWMECENGFLKTDATDHNADHFFPGCQDIAWDVAGTLAEFDWNDDAKQYFINRIASHDRSIRSRLSFYAIAYLSYRLGYSKMAADVLCGSPDGARFSALKERYMNMLKRCADERR